MKRRSFCQALGLTASAALVAPALTTRVAFADFVKDRVLLRYRLQVATNDTFGAGELIADLAGLVTPSHELQDLGADTTYYWRVNATDGVATSDWSETNRFTTGAAVAAETVPEAFTTSLAPNYPNPFRDRTTFPFTLAEGTHVELVIYNVAGQEVASLVGAWRPSGAHEVDWAPQGLAAGTYVAVLRAGAATQTRTFVRL